MRLLIVSLNDMSRLATDLAAQGPEVAILQRRGALQDAKRCFRNARDLCAARPPDEIVPLTDGEAAGRLAEAAAVQLHSLQAAIGRRS